MTRFDIIRMAREAGFEEFILDEVDGVPIYELVESKVVFERFANLVAAAEREACAKVCDKIGDEYADANPADCASAIRERLMSLHAAPPQREWVGLTDEEILEEYRQSYGDDGNLADIYFAHAIEAKLKEKNGG